MNSYIFETLYTQPLLSDYNSNLEEQFSLPSTYSEMHLDSSPSAPSGEHLLVSWSMALISFPLMSKDWETPNIESALMILKALP